MGLSALLTTHQPHNLTTRILPLGIFCTNCFFSRIREVTSVLVEGEKRDFRGACIRHKLTDLVSCNERPTLGASSTKL